MKTKILTPVTKSAAARTLLLAALLPAVILAADFPGLFPSPYFNEQTVTFMYGSDIRVRINMGPAENYDPNLPLDLVLFALPNGNTIEQTEGKWLEDGDDWHFDIQHIAAQTRFVRQALNDRNTILVYLESKQLSWPTWKAEHPDYQQIIKNLDAYLRSLFRDYDLNLHLNGHSGGGRFIFSYMDAFPLLPDYVKRISFLDSDYGYETGYGNQLKTWLADSNNHFLTVIAYNDSVALYNGEPIVSATGGTWYRSRWMQRELAEDLAFSTVEDDSFIKHRSENGQVVFYLKKNPERLILHTVQVERNGFIESMLFGTESADVGYVYYGDRAYTNLIQHEITAIPAPLIPPRSPDFAGASEILDLIENYSFENRESVLLQEISKGNIPDFLRQLHTVSYSVQDINGQSRNIEYLAFPDYLAIGSDEDFCRMPMGPKTAQHLADLFGMTLPTPKIVDRLWQEATMKLEPITYTPVGNDNEQVFQFIRHNTDIEAARVQGGFDLGETAGGLKKDVVLSNKIIDPSRPGHVCIYGWHYTSGVPIQPLTNIHYDYYVDYSHGIRLLSGSLLMDGELMTQRDVLRDAVLYRTLSDESGAMQQPYYLYDASGLPPQPRIHGLKTGDDGIGYLYIGDLPESSNAIAMLSRNGIDFTEVIPPFPNPFRLISTDSTLYVKANALNFAGLSASTSLLACRGDNSAADILVVDGFDRGSTGNSYDFIREYAGSLDGRSFHSCTNDALISGLFNLADYPVVILFLGDESTVDESFSSAEQTLYRNYLKAGGMLLVSGSEIAWDLDAKGASLDKSYLWYYLKAAYKYDAPGGISGSCYKVNALDSSPFTVPASFSFSDGSVRGINVNYADVLTPMNGGRSVMVYDGYTESNGTAGISYEGLFPGGTRPGRLVYLGFPFESITDAQARTELLSSILDWFSSDLPTDLEKPQVPEEFRLISCAPNPFNSEILFKVYSGLEPETVYHVYDIQGRKIDAGSFRTPSPGIYDFRWNASHAVTGNLASGVYLFRLQNGDNSELKRITFIK